MNVPFKAIIFDLDGTLIDSAPDLLAGINHVLSGHAPLIDLEHMRPMMGDGAVKLIERGLEATGLTFESDEMEQMVEDFLIHYEENISVLTRPFDGVMETLYAMKEAGLTLAICTNKRQSFMEKVLADLEMDVFFDVLIGGGATGSYKPEAAHLMAVVDALELGPHECVMIGDSYNDVAAARACAMPVVAVTFGYSKDPVESLDPDAVIEHFSALPQALTEL